MRALVVVLSLFYLYFACETLFTVAVSFVNTSVKKREEKLATIRNQRVVAV